MMLKTYFKTALWVNKIEIVTKDERQDKYIKDSIRYYDYY